MELLMRELEARLARACRAVAEFVGRLSAVFLAMLVFLPASAQATIQATPLYTAYSIRWNPRHVAWGPGVMPDANACIGMYADWNAEIQSDPSYFVPLTGVEYADFSGAYPYICSHYQTYSDGRRIYSSVWLQQTTNVCPANSTADSPNGWWCTCNPGFVQQANNCVRPEVASPTPNSCPAPDGLFKGQPIAPATGEKFSVEADGSDGGASPLSFSRTYRSGWMADSARPLAGLGLVWSHNHYARLDATPTGDPTEVAIINSDGTVRRFARTAGSGSWTTANGSDTLVQLAGGAWTYDRAEDGSILTFAPDGKVLSREGLNRSPNWPSMRANDAHGDESHRQIPRIDEACA